ncbi:MAG: autotransporter outer membrane beta-barrel domain-containing protein [Pseudomonadota bacterium]
MRIRGVQLAGLAVALAGGMSAKDAVAADLTISTATTTPVTTSNANAGAGNVTVDTAGTITVTAGQTAITLDSNNSVNNLGTLASNNADNTTGIVITGVHTGSANNPGTISMLEDYSLSDTDSDGDVDGAWTVSPTSNRTGIWLQSGATLTGNIGGVGAINIEGGHSAGVRIDGVLTGDLNAGSISVTGDNSRGIVINNTISGNVGVQNGIGIRGLNSVGLEVNAAVGGGLNLNGSWDVSGFHVQTHPTSSTVISALDADDLLLSGSAVAVHANIGHGVTIQGVGIEDDVDDDGDGVTEAQGDTDDDRSASISVATSAPAILITPDATTPTTITLGDTGRGYGFVNRGGITAQGVYNGNSATVLRMDGVAGADVNVTGGVLNDGSMTGIAYEANAYDIYLGDHVTATRVVTRGNLNSRSVSDGNFSAYGVFFASGANVGAFNNSGTMNVQLLGETGNAVGIVDQSNSLANIVNSGSISTAVIATDSDLTDDVPAPAVTGSSIAIDVHTSTINVTYTQLADADNPLRNGNDDDTVDDNAGELPSVLTIGDIRFGSGDDTLSLQSGYIFGDVSFGDGSNTFLIDHGANYFGALSKAATGTLNINVTNGLLHVTDGTAEITSAHFGADGKLGVTLSTGSDSAMIHATGLVTFDVGAQILPTLPSGLPTSGSVRFLTADAGFSNTQTNVTRVLAGTDAPFLYNAAIVVDATDATNHSLAVSFQQKSATELGLNANQSAALAPMITALRTDTKASTAFAGLHTSEDFFTAYNSLLPGYASGAAELAATAIQQGQAATTNRLAATRLNSVHDVSVWAQEIGYGLERNPTNTTALRYRGSGFGFAAGIDGPLENGGLFGLSASFISSDVEEPARVDGEIAASFGQVGAYLGTSMGPVDLDFTAGAGLGKERSRRFVDIGPSFEAISEAEWWAYEGHGSVRASAPMRSGGFFITPQVQLTYVVLQENGYTEKGGGTAIDYKIDGTTTQRLWADAAIEFGTRWVTGGDTVMTPRLTLGYRANVLDESTDRTVRFASGGDPFTLTDPSTGSGAPIVGLGFDATNGYSTLSIAYEGEFGDEITRHSLNVALRFKF